MLGGCDRGMRDHEPVSRQLWSSVLVDMASMAEKTS